MRLELHQRFDGIDIQLVRRVRIQLLEIGSAAEIGEQQEASLDILRKDIRHGNACIGK